MKIVTDLHTSLQQKTAATVGFFDGVHTGHVTLLNRLKKEASQRNLASMVVTFATHPREILQSNYVPELLTTTQERIDLLAKNNIDICVLLPFSNEMAKLNSEEFMQHILKNTLQTDYLLVGHDHRFGSDRQNGVDEYSQSGKIIGIEVESEDAYIKDETCVSSSVIRRALSANNIEEANAYLNYPYFVHGTVVGGKQIGRTIGFPTANIATNDHRKMIPADGVYAVQVTVKDKTYAGMMNIGTRPTIDNAAQKTLEVHILNFHDSIYQEPIKIEFLHFLRKEMKFNSLDELVAQLFLDKENTSSLFQKR
jgi:riboflavin kinase / FMN adenylyltransferase